MAQLIVRNLEETVARELKIRAARRGRPAEAEHREILRQALLGHSRSSLKELLLAMPDVGRDEDFDRLRDMERILSPHESYVTSSPQLRPDAGA